jgi:hypothetical protein
MKKTIAITEIEEYYKNSLIEIIHKFPNTFVNLEKGYIFNVEIKTFDSSLDVDFKTDKYNYHHFKLSSISDAVDILKKLGCHNKHKDVDKALKRMYFDKFKDVEKDFVLTLNSCVNVCLY